MLIEQYDPVLKLKDKSLKSLIIGLQAFVKLGKVFNVLR